MPIYGYGTLGAPWSICTTLEVKKLADLEKIFNSAMHSFPGRNDMVFMHSIDLNMKLDECYIAKYDYSKTGIPLAIYQEKMTSLIKYANDILISTFKKRKKYDDYKFDIQGSWTIGKVIIMKRNKDT